ncbi:BTAD domain-containing putative transcriptional regulator [Nocardia macrotermitis]|uniref:Bacterial transcriptional activator domain-containing protein n=1 Tax=Nocardia macrotermitis TaxID=2585198 RepID=A0A7K0DB46_9NOCA|nr:BTAD domain-containing putative transcriptional regulator [Nocardia macrotermitis]MQY23016.1 hypothetical protein [Nocardia macrotermitis]
MTPTPAPATPAPRRPLLIAVAGLTPRTGVTTTTVALAHSWSGPEPAVLVEADLVGGQLAELAAADPYRGLASMSWAAHVGAQPVQVIEHVQYLRNGVGFLASPPGYDTERDAWVTMLLTGRHHDRELEELAAWHELGATVFVDCGAPGPGSALEPILTHADACLVLVHADHPDPDSAGHQIRELVGRTRHPGVLLLGADTDSDYANALRVPALATVPHHRPSATALLRHKPRPWDRNRVLSAARTTAATIDTQLRPPPARPPSTQTNTPHPHTPPRPRVGTLGRPVTGPTVYRIDRPADLRRGPGGASPGPVRDRPGTHAPAPTPPWPRIPPAAPTPPGPAGGSEPPGTAEPSTPNPARPAPPDTGTAPSAQNRDLPASPQPAASRPVPLAETALAGGTGPGLQIQVFGPTRILWRTSSDADIEAAEITRRLEPRSRELLAVLALHPDGLTQPELIEALWGQHPPHRPVKALGNALSRLRTTLVTVTGGPVAGLFTDDRPRYRLGPAVRWVDYWEFGEAVTQRRAAHGEADQAAACARIAAIATAPLAADLSHLWAEPLREATRRDTLGALSWLADHPAAHDPRATLGMLETAVKTDPYNEQLWQYVLRLHARLGEHDALDRTYAVLERKLAEINTEPDQETRQLLDHLRRTTR